MKEVTGTARNLMLALTPDEKAIQPMIEAILVVTEPNYRFNKEGDISRSRDHETIRFTATPESLRKIAVSFAEWADQAEALTKATGLKKFENSNP